MGEVVVDSRRRIRQIVANGVLGEYTHRVEFRDPGDFAIIFGPNGVGKTRFLEIIDALANLRVDRLDTLPFENVVLEYDDGSSLSVTRALLTPGEIEEWSDFKSSTIELKRALAQLRDLDSDDQPVRALQFHLVERPGESITFPPVLLGFSEDDLLALAARRRTASPSVRAEIDEMLHLGRNVDYKLYHRAKELSRFVGGLLPEKLREFAQGFDVRLIETQRLLTQEIEARATAAGGRREQVTSRPTIEEYSKVVRERLEHDLSENSRLAQRLDSTFPRRMLEAGESSRVTEKEIRGRLKDQSTKRARIEQITPLGLGAALPLPSGTLSAAQRSVLELYLDDAEAKLSTFANTVERIDVLEKIVNGRLLDKRLRISAEEGISISRDSDNTRIPLTSLSSGEQHEIILIFDLLFNVEPGGLVLIDEPEISLHIAWQQMFIADVVTIARLVGFQFIIATHSPQIIENFWAHAQRLGPKSAPFDQSRARL